MDALFSALDETIRSMPNQEFSSHEFILALVGGRQRAYVDALNQYPNDPEPFTALHMRIGEELGESALVVKIGEMESYNMFARRSRCGVWRRRDD